jgi:hypothetical protein
MYVASRRWILGVNPYQSSGFKETWVASGGKFFQGNRGSETNVRPAYPPSSLPVLAPFAIFRWHIARNLFLFSAVALFPVLLYFALQLNQIAWTSDAGLLSCAFALALSPWHAAIAGQSISAQTIELAVIGSSLSSTFGGLLTGVALCLKPQLAIWFVLFEIAKRRWYRVLLACALFLAVSCLALTRMPSGWLESYRENLHYFFAVGGVNDFTLNNPVRFELLNLQSIFYYLTRMYEVANICSWIVTACLVFFWFRRRPASDVVQLSAIALIGLLPLYQRIYNAGLVVLVLPYAITRWSEVKGKLLLAFCAIFLVPGVAILQTLWQRHWISDAVWKQSSWFNLLAGPHATWAILGIIMILLFWQDKTSTTGFRE